MRYNQRATHATSTKSNVYITVHNETSAPSSLHNPVLTTHTPASSPTPKHLYRLWMNEHWITE